MEINRCLETFYNGDPLNNKDLVQLRDHTLKAVELLSHMGPSFLLACNEARKISDTCTSYLNARRNKRNRVKQHMQNIHGVS